MEKATSITVHQAYYGEVNRSHGCLSSTIDDSDLKSFLTAFTDRPTSIPAGINLQPYYSGKNYGNYFVFTLTVSDPSASRGGMVFTHALIVSLEDLNAISNLAELFTLFISAVPEAKTEVMLTPFNVPISKQKQPVRVVPKYIKQTIEKLVENKTPILFCGQLEAFKSIIFAIWQGLSSAFRKKISFTAGFGTDRLDMSSTIIYFQNDLVGILRNQDFISDNQTNEVTVTSEVEQYVLNAQADNAFEHFLNNLGVVPSDWSLLSSSVKAFQLYSKLEGRISVDETRLLVRMLGKIMPDPNKGREIKNIVLSKLKDCITTGEDINLKALRNLPLSAFEKGVEMVANAMDTLLNKQFADHLPFDVQAIGEICLLATQKENRNWWQEAISFSLQKIGSEKKEAVVIHFWQLLSYTETWIQPVLSFIPNDPRYENSYVQQLPAQLSDDLAHSLAKFTEQRHWFFLHAQLLLHFLAPREALAKQIQIEKRYSPRNSGIPLLLSKVVDSDLLTLSLSIKEEVLISEFGKRSISHPILLAPLDVMNPTWLEIWSVSLEGTKNLHHGIYNIEVMVKEIIHLISTGQAVPEKIVECIADSSFADLSNILNRKEVWQHLTWKTKPKLLAATAAGYAKHLLEGTLTNSELEMELKTEITNDTFVSTFLSKHRNEFDAVLTFYENVNGLKDSFLADYIRHYTGSVSDIESSRLGSLVQSRNLRLSARQVLEKAKHDHSFRIALNECRSLLQLGFIDRLRFGYLWGENISEEALYTALFEFAKQAYSQGPEHHDIWKRAGGDLSKLTNHRSREENWRQALSLLRHGGGGKHITLRSLITEMQYDYPNNADLKEFKRYS